MCLNQNEGLSIQIQALLQLLLHQKRELKDEFNIFNEFLISLYQLTRNCSIEMSRC